MKNVSVLGVGYVGLVTAACLASRGVRTYASTHDPKKAELINRGVSPFFEPGLEPLLKSAVSSGLLTCGTDAEEAVGNSEITFITVATPSGPDGSIDLSLMARSGVEIGESLRGKGRYHLVVVKSTVVPGTTEELVKPRVEEASGLRAGRDFGLCMNPEFLREGSAVGDTFHTDRVVIGEYDAGSGEILEDLYREFYAESQPPILRMNLASAEMIKYASNAFLATKISFINEIANLCERTPGIDVKEVARGMGLDARIGPRFLEAGLGFGGACFPKDVKAILNYARAKGYRPRILEAILRVNDDQALRGVELAEGLVGGLGGMRVAVLGLSFKPDTSDIREASSLRVIDQLLKLGAKVTAYDPVAIPEVKTLYGEKIGYADSALKCLEGADCCIVTTEWEEFKKLTPEDFKSRMRSPNIVDGRRIFDPRTFSKVGYVAVGKAP